MVKIRQAIVVEGRYDKNTLSQVVDAPIFQTNGFGIRKDKALLALLRRVAQTRGLIVFTDSDGAGLVIRNFIKGAIPASQLLHAYIPQVYGKERRKSAPAKEGMLGVEGMSPEVILDCLRRAGATFEDADASRSESDAITKQLLVEVGLSGGKDSSRLRAQLQKTLGFPTNMSANALLQALNLLYTPQQLRGLVSQMELDKSGEIQ